VVFPDKPVNATLVPTVADDMIPELKSDCLDTSIQYCAPGSPVQLTVKPEELTSVNTGSATPVFAKYSDFFSTRDASGKGLADYSNRNFFTAGTNLGSNPYSSPSNDRGRYTEERIDNLVFLRGDVTDTQTGEVKNIHPCIDFSHYHARTGGAQNSYPEFCATLERIEKALGRPALENLHMHVSGINYTAKGERNHLILEESDLEYKALLKALKDFKVGGNLVCESPNLEEDAALLKKTYGDL